MRELVNLLSSHRMTGGASDLRVPPRQNKTGCIMVKSFALVSEDIPSLGDVTFTALLPFKGGAGVLVVRASVTCLTSLLIEVFPPVLWHIGNEIQILLFVLPQVTGRALQAHMLSVYGEFGVDAMVEIPNLFPMGLIMTI